MALQSRRQHATSKSPDAESSMEGRRSQAETRGMEPRYCPRPCTLAGTECSPTHDGRSPPKQGHVNVRTVALLQDTKSQVLDRLDNQDRMQTSTALTLVETIRAEATEVIKVIQHTTVQTRSRSLSVHSQVEPKGFASQTTRVRRRLLTYHIIDPDCQVAVNKTTSLASFSILSPDASLSYEIGRAHV